MVIRNNGNMINQKTLRIRQLAVFLLISMFFWCFNTKGYASHVGKAEFIVMADPHFYDPELGTTGDAFENYLMADHKLLRESEPILHTFIEETLAAAPDFVMIPGDLTKDGEKRSHQKLADQLARLESAGIDVYIVPGNHDINNPNAMAYGHYGAMPVDTVTPEEFIAIYSAYGFDEAIDRDAESLSYLVEPVDGLWILGLDSCNYDANDTNSEIGGSFNPGTLHWIRDRLADARKQEKTVLAMMHHNLLEHFNGQSQVPIIGSEYVIEDWEYVSKILHAGGLRLIFTGHHHAQDATAAYYPVGNNTQPLYDVMTSSLVCYPCAYRTVYVNGTTADIDTRLIADIDYDTGGLSFREYAENALVKWIVFQFSTFLQQEFDVSSDTAELLSSLAADTLIAYFCGDESPSLVTRTVISALLSNPNTAEIGDLLSAIWTDLPPADNYLSLDIFPTDTTIAEKLIFPMVIVDNHMDTEIKIINGNTIKSVTGKFKGYSETGDYVTESQWITLLPNSSLSFNVKKTFAVAESIAYFTFESDLQTSDLQGCVRLKKDNSFRASVSATRKVAGSVIPVPHIASTEDWITCIRIINTTTEIKTIRYQFNTKEIIEITLPPEGVHSSSVRELFGGYPQPAITSGVIRNASGVIGLCDFRSADTKPHAYWSVLMLANNFPVNSYIPRLINDDNEVTGLAVYNPLEIPCDVVMTPYDKNGNALLKKTVNISAGEKFVGVMESLDFPKETSWCKVRGSTGVSILTLHVSRDGNRMIGFSTPVSGQPTGIFPVLEKNDGHTLIGIVNSSEKANQITLTGWDEQGEKQIEDTLTLTDCQMVEGTLDRFLPIETFTPELLNSMTYISFTACEPVIGYQIGVSTDKMSADGLNISSMP